MEILKEEVLTLVKTLREKQTSPKFNFNKKAEIRAIESEIDRLIKVLDDQQAQATILSQHELKIQVAVLQTGEIRNRIILPTKLTAKLIIEILNGLVTQINENVKTQLRVEGIDTNSPGYVTRRDTMLIQAFIPVKTP
jgi:hypothetical protein